MSSDRTIHWHAGRLPEANTFRELVLQDLDRVAIKDTDHLAKEVACEGKRFSRCHEHGYSKGYAGEWK